MTYVAVRSSRWQYLMLLSVSLAFVGSGILILAAGKNAAVAWMSIVFFGACAAVFTWQVIDARPRLIISDKGIYDRMLGVGTIPWEEIVDAHVVSIFGNDFICLHLAQPEKYVVRLSGIRRAMSSANQTLGFTDFALNLSGISVDTATLLELIMKKSAEANLLQHAQGVASGSPIAARSDRT